MYCEEKEGIGKERRKESGKRMKRSVGQKNDRAQQMKNGTSFHSIYYRYFTFIFSLLIMIFYAIGKGKGLAILHVTLPTAKLQLSPLKFALYGNGILLLVSIPFYFYKKLFIGKEGIYLPGIKLFVPWEEISAVSHVWISEASLAKKEGVLFYNRKTIVFYRKEKKPICVYNISILSLYAVKYYRPSMPGNLFFASLSTSCNITLNALFLLEGYLFYFRGLSLGAFMIWILCYFAKATLLPLWILKRENRIHGSFLRHDSLLNGNRSDAIHI